MNTHINIYTLISHITNRLCGFATVWAVAVIALYWEKRRELDDLFIEDKEHIEYTFAAFCRVVLHNVAMTVYRDFGRTQQREGSLEYIISKTLFEVFTIDDTLEVLQERIGKTLLPKWKKIHLQKDGKVNLLMDIQVRLQGRGPDLERWMKIHNLKEASKTLNYFTKHGIPEYAVLSERAGTMATDFESVSTSIKQMEYRMEQMASLKTHIINYTKTRDTYAAYRKTKAADKPAFRTTHEAAKRAFDAQGVKKLPTIQALQAEYTELLAKKKAAYEDYMRSSPMWMPCSILKNNSRKRILPFKRSVATTNFVVFRQGCVSTLPGDWRTPH